MDNKKRTSFLLLIIGILVLALAGAIGYIVGDLNSKATPSQSISNNDEVMQEIEELKSMYDSKIAEKTNSFRDLKEQKTKVESLMYELEKTKSDANSLIKYKTQYQQLESKMKTLVSEIMVLKSGKSTAVAKVKSTKLTDNSETTKTTIFNKKEQAAQRQKEIPVKKESTKPSSLNKLDKPTENATVVEEKLPPKIEETKIEEYKVSNVKVVAFNVKSSGKLEETESASKTKMVKINFSVSGSKEDNKTYYIQIINSKNNVMGKKITEFFGDKSLTYSFPKTVDLSNGTVSVSQEVFDANFEKGTYFINVFDKSKLVGNSSITLK